MPQSTVSPSTMAHPPFFPHHRRAYFRNAAFGAFLPIFHRLCSIFYKKYAAICSLNRSLPYHQLHGPGREEGLPACLALSLPHRWSFFCMYSMVGWTLYRIYHWGPICSKYSITIESIFFRWCRVKKALLQDLITALFNKSWSFEIGIRSSERGSRIILPADHLLAICFNGDMSCRSFGFVLIYMQKNACMCLLDQ